MYKTYPIKALSKIQNSWIPWRHSLIFRSFQKYVMVVFTALVTRNSINRIFPTNIKKYYIKCYIFSIPNRPCNFNDSSHFGISLWKLFQRKIRYILRYSLITSCFSKRFLGMQRTYLVIFKFPYIQIIKML